MGHLFLQLRTSIYVYQRLGLSDSFISRFLQIGLVTALAAVLVSRTNSIRVPAGSCGDNGEGCTLVETTLVNPTTPGSGSSTDISLIPP